LRIGFTRVNRRNSTVSIASTPPLLEKERGKVFIKEGLTPLLNTPFILVILSKGADALKVRELKRGAASLN
jgi:hypothetical protein